jgi:phosphate acetyltransferase
MQLEHFLERLEDGDLVITPGDRDDLILGTIVANFSKEFPSIAGILITGGFKPGANLMRLIGGIKHFSLPILMTTGDTYDAVTRVEGVPSKMQPGSERKIALAKGAFRTHVDTGGIEKRIGAEESDTVTPLMFEYGLFETARSDKRHIVLPESGDERVLRAVEILLRRDVVTITLLGNRDEVTGRAAELGLDIKGADIIDPVTSPLLDEFARDFYELRRHKGISPEDAREAMQQVSYFATMMVHKGKADGMVSGAVHTTQETIRPALQIIKTKPGISIVSSVFFMCLETRVLVYGDCAVNLDPTAEELAQIALSSAQTAAAFGIDPKIALLSYSTGSSGKGDDVEKVREATRIAKENRPDLAIDGPIQYDAAIDPSVGQQKLPGSPVAGQATVFVFPDLNTGNNTYKAVQRSSGAVAIGPVLQGLNKPVNDLSRGCLVEDIVNTVAITAIQAQGEAE